MVKTYTTELAGRPLVMEFGKYCGQANGSVIVRLGDTVVMVNATASDTPREGQDFFPLSVDFEEKMYSVGKIPGGFIKREGRPSEKATLTSRLIDRPLRPLFNKGMRNDVQVVATVLSVEQDVPPDIPAMLGASAAIAAEAPIIAGISGGTSCSTESTVATTCTSLRMPLLNSGRSGRSIRREVSVAFSDGRPSRLMKPPGILPTEYIFSSKSTLNGKKS